MNSLGREVPCSWCPEGRRYSSSIPAPIAERMAVSELDAVEEAPDTVRFIRQRGLRCVVE